jgi:hypothetical protein
MATPEPEQYIGQGNEKAWWLFTWKNVGGMVVGGYAGSSLGDLIGGPVVLVVVGIALGFFLTRAKRGLMRVRRMGQVAWFYAMSVIALPVVDAAAYYASTADDDDDPGMWTALMVEEENP